MGHLRGKTPHTSRHNSSRNKNGRSGRRVNRGLAGKDTSLLFLGLQKYPLAFSFFSRTKVLEQETFETHRRQSCPDDFESARWRYLRAATCRLAVRQGQEGGCGRKGGGRGKYLGAFF